MVVDSWNLMGNILELADFLDKRMIHVACIQETSWQGVHSREANSYKLWYTGLANSSNDMGILLSKELKDNIRCNDSIMSIRVVVGERVLNVICAYAPHIYLGVLVKVASCLDELVRVFLTINLLFWANWLIGDGVKGYHSAHGDFGFKVKNARGSALLDFAVAHELVISSSIFQKRAEHLITFSSGGHITQTTFFYAFVMLGRA
ncbi:hypothetical protein OROGR_004229 [Orobanche gracilis]